MQRLNRPPTVKVTVSKPKPRTQATGDHILAEQSGQIEIQERQDYIARDSGQYGLLEHRAPSSRPTGYTDWETREPIHNPARSPLDIDDADLAQLEALQQRIDRARIRITSNPLALPSHRSDFDSEPQPVSCAPSVLREEPHGTAFPTTVAQPLQPTRAPSSQQQSPVVTSSSAAPLQKVERQANSKRELLSDDQANELLQQAKKLSIFVHAWIEKEVVYDYPRDKVLESIRLDRDVLSSTVSSLSRDEEAYKKIFLLRDVYDTLKPDFHEMFALGYGPLKKLISKGAQTRSTFINTLKTHVSEIFHGYLSTISKDPSARRTSKECLNLLGYNSENQTFPAISLILFFPGSSGFPQDNALFRSRAVAIILLIVLFGPSSLQGKSQNNKATNGVLWQIKEINAAAVAWGCIAARFLLSGDNNFKPKGEETGINYQRDYEQYKTLITGRLRINDTDMIATMQYYHNALLTSNGRIALAQDIHPEMIGQASDEGDPVMLSLLREVDNMTFKDSDDQATEPAVLYAREAASSSHSWEVEEVDYPDNNSDRDGEQELPPPLPSLAVSGKKKKKKTVPTSKAKGKGRALEIEKEPVDLLEKRPRPRPVQVSSKSTPTVQPARQSVAAESTQPASLPPTRSTRSRPTPEDHDLPAITSQPRRSTRGRAGTGKSDSSSAQPASTTRSRKTPPVSSKQHQKNEKITQSATSDDSGEERVSQVHWKEPLEEWEESPDFSGPQRLRRKQSTTPTSDVTSQKTTSSKLSTISEQNEGPSFAEQSRRSTPPTAISVPSQTSATVKATPHTVTPRYAPVPSKKLHSLPSRHTPASSSTYQFTPVDDDDGEIVENPSDEDAIAHVMYYKNAAPEDDVTEEEETEEEDPDDESENENYSDEDSYVALGRQIYQRR